MVGMSSPVTIEAATLHQRLSLVTAKSRALEVRVRQLTTAYRQSQTMLDEKSKTIRLLQQQVSNSSTSERQFVGSDSDLIYFPSESGHTPGTCPQPSFLVLDLR